MEVNKLIAEVALHFEFDFVDSDREWTVYNDWFVSPRDIMVKVKVYARQGFSDHRSATRLQGASTAPQPIFPYIGCCFSRLVAVCFQRVHSAACT